MIDDLIDWLDVYGGNILLLLGLVIAIPLIGTIIILVWAFFITTIRVAF